MLFSSRRLLGRLLVLGRRFLPLPSLGFGGLRWGFGRSGLGVGLVCRVLILGLLGRFGLRPRMPRCLLGFGRRCRLTLLPRLSGPSSMIAARLMWLIL